MALSIDPSLALRTHKQLTELVEAIVAADRTEPETNAVEWKSRLDLADAEARFKIGKHVIGFSNRHPDDAARQFEGCAYIVIGAEPQTPPNGVFAHDPAALDDWIGPFVGSDGPRWKPDYVKVDGRDVLVMTVEAPRLGDPIHVLQKGSGTVRAGRPFIRRQGKTIEPDPDEMRMLEERLKRAASRVRVGVELTGDRPTFYTYKTAATSRSRGGERSTQRLYGLFGSEVGPQGLSTLRGTLRSSGPWCPRTSRSAIPRHLPARSRGVSSRAKDSWQGRNLEEAIEKELADLRAAHHEPGPTRTTLPCRWCPTLPPSGLCVHRRQGPRRGT